MRTIKTSALLVLLLAAATVVGQRHAAPVEQSAPAGFSAERLARLDRLLQQYVDEQRFAGVVALVLRDGRPVYEKAVGWSDREAGRPMSMDTIVRIASQSKAVTSVAIMQLVEEGRLALSTPVSQLIPAYAKATVAGRGDNAGPAAPVRRAITIRDLLTHTAGISYGTDAHVSALYEAKGLGPAAGFGWYTADKDEPVCDTMERLTTVPFVSQPGEAYVYGYATDILGCVVERASGLRLDEYFATRITGPLGMKDTFFFLPDDRRDRLAAVYTSGPDRALVRAPEGARGQGHYVTGPRRNFSGGAGLVSTAHDYARFLEMLRRGGTLDGAQILSPRTVALMTTNLLGPLYATDGRGFGLGFETTDRFGANGLESAGSFGWGGAYGSSYRVDPQERLVFVLMIQLLQRPTDIREKFPTLVYQALEGPRPGTH